MIIMREHPALYQLCIEDNGTAVSSAAGRAENGDADSFRQGIGLANMRERVRDLKGTFQIMEQQGFKIFITIPKEL